MTRLAERLVTGSAQVVSGLLTVVGLVGLLKTSFTDFAGSEGVDFLGLRVNPLTNCIHLGAGLIGIAMATRLDKARRYLGVVGAAGVVFALVEFALGDSGSDIFGRDTTVAVAQLVIAAGSLGVWLWARSVARSDQAGRLGIES